MPRFNSGVKQLVLSTITIVSLFYLCWLWYESVYSSVFSTHAIRESFSAGTGRPLIIFVKNAKKNVCPRPPEKMHHTVPMQGKVVNGSIKDRIYNIKSQSNLPTKSSVNMSLCSPRPISFTSCLSPPNWVLLPLSSSTSSL